MSDLFGEAKEFIESLDERLIGSNQHKRLTKDDSIKAAVYLHRLYSQGKSKEVLNLWAKIQKTTDVLWSVHPYIEKLMVLVALNKTPPKLFDFSEKGIRERANKFSCYRKAINSYIDDNGTIVVELEPELNEE